MYEKILSLLTAKFSQARKDGLAQMARSLAIHTADETEAQALVEKITADKVTDFIKDWRKEVDSEVSRSTKTFEDNLKGKYDFVEKTPDPAKPKPTDDIAAIINAALKPLQDKITSMEKGKSTDVRKTALETKLKDAPEAFKKTVLKGFGKMSFESDEEFNSFIEETEADMNEFVQATSNSGLSVFPKPGVPAGGNLSKDAIAKDIQQWADGEKKPEQK